MKKIIIGSDNGLSPDRYQAIIWTDAGLLSIEPLANIFQWKSYQNTTIFIEENARENVVCEMASILSRPQYVNMTDEMLRNLAALRGLNVRRLWGATYTEWTNKIALHCKSVPHMCYTCMHSCHDFFRQHIYLTGVSTLGVRAHNRDGILVLSHIKSPATRTFRSGQWQGRHLSPALLVFCEGNPPVTGGFPSQRVSIMESVGDYARSR